MKPFKGIVTSGFLLVNRARRRLGPRAKSTICMSGTRTEIAQKVPILGEHDAVHDGVLVVHRRLAKEIVEIFGELFCRCIPDPTHAHLTRSV